MRGRAVHVMANLIIIQFRFLHSLLKYIQNNAILIFLMNSLAAFIKGLKLRALRPSPILHINHAFVSMNGRFAYKPTDTQVKT